MKILEITTDFPCKNMCSYCPQKLLIENYKGRPTLTHYAFLKMLESVPKDVILNFAGFCEPFQNPECSNFIVMADRLGYKIKVLTTLVGFTEDDAFKIKDIKFDRFYVHDIGQPKDYPFVTESMTDAEYAPFITSRAGALWEVPEKPFGECKAQGNCSDAVALPNGDLYCCMDYGLTRKLGNIFKMNFNDIPRLTEFELCKFCEYNQ